jgi:hypothetical protein
VFTVPKKNIPRARRMTQILGSDEHLDAVMFIGSEQSILLLTSISRYVTGKESLARVGNKTQISKSQIRFSFDN